MSVGATPRTPLLTLREVYGGRSPEVSDDLRVSLNPKVRPDPNLVRDEGRGPVARVSSYECSESKKSNRGSGGIWWWAKPYFNSRHHR